MKSNNSQWPEGKKVRGIEKIYTFGHMNTQRCVDGENAKMVKVIRCLSFSQAFPEHLTYIGSMSMTTAVWIQCAQQPQVIITRGNN